MDRLSTLSKFHKTVLGTAVFLALAVPAGLSLTINHWLSNNEQNIVASLNEALGTSVAIRDLRFQLAQGIVIDDFVMKGEQATSLPSPVRIARIRMKPSVALYPQFALDWRVVMERPHFTVRAGIQDVVHMGRFFSSSPRIVKKIGPFMVTAKLASLEIKNGKATLISPVPDRPWRQEFEGVQVFLGHQWTGGERLSLKGHIAGNAEASFRVTADVRSAEPAVIRTKISLDFQRFTTAYLTPHLADYIKLPDEELTAAVEIKMKGDTLWSKGKIVLPKLSEGKSVFFEILRFASPQLKYSLKGHLEKDVFRFLQISVKTPRTELKGEGDVKFTGKTAFCNISLASKKIPLRHLKRLFPQFRLDSGYLRLFIKIKGLGNSLSPAAELAFENCEFRHTIYPLVFSKLQGRVYLSKNRFVVNEVWAFVNGLPVRVKMGVHRFNKMRVHLEGSTYPGQAPLLERNRLYLSAGLNGVYDGQKWDADLWIKNKTRSASGEPRQETWQATFRGAVFDGKPLHHFPKSLAKGLKLRSRAVMVERRTPDVSLRTMIRNTQLFVSHQNNELRCDVLEGIYHGGKLFMRSWFNTTRFPLMAWKLSGSLTDADTASLLTEWSLKYPLTGRLSLEATAKGQADHVSQLAAKFRVLKGQAGPVPALERLAEQTGIQSLMQIPFNEISGNAAYDKATGLELRPLKLTSQDAEMTANLKIHEKRMAGTLSAKFSEAALKQSADLKFLLEYVGEKSGGWIDFEFKLAGFLNAPRVQWLTSNFKKRVEARLSPWMRNRLAQEIEKRFSTPT